MFGLTPGQCLLRKITILFPPETNSPLAETIKNHKNFFTLQILSLKELIKLGGGFILCTPLECLWFVARRIKTSSVWGIYWMLWAKKCLNLSAISLIRG